MKLRPIAVAVLCALVPMGQAYAWLLQPPFEVPEAAAEIDRFQEGSATMLDAFSDLNGILAEAERNHAPLSLEALSAIRAEIQRAIGLYREAATENLARLPLSIEALSEFSTMLASSLRADYLPQMTNAADLAFAMADIASEIDQTLAILIESGGISPDDPLNIDAREGIAQLSFQMNLFVQVGNAGAAGIGISMPK